MSKTITIPTDRGRPFVVIHNGITHIYEPGETVEVPDGIALEIEECERWDDKYMPEIDAPSSGGTGGGSGGAEVKFEVTRITFHIENNGGAELDCYVRGIILDEDGYVKYVDDQIYADTDTTICTPPYSVLALYVESEGWGIMPQIENVEPEGWTNVLFSNPDMAVFEILSDDTINITVTGDGMGL